MIDTLDVVSDAVKDCMKAEVEGFELTEDEAKGFEDLDDVADKAADGQEQAKQIMARFQDDARLLQHRRLNVGELSVSRPVRARVPAPSSWAAARRSRVPGRRRSASGGG